MNAYALVPLLAAVIGLVIRGLKADVSFLPTIAPRYRPWVAMGLGLVSSVLIHLTPGTSWSAAVIEGLVAGLGAIAGHELGIESLRRGAELGAPDPADAPTKPMLPPDPPSGPLALLVAVAFAGVVVLQGCTGGGAGAKAPTARDTARAGVLLVSEGVRVADEACAVIGAAKKDASVLKTCADAYDTARASLLAAEAAVDAWDAGERKDLGCAVGAAVRALDQIVKAAVAAGASLPVLVTDALTLGAAFAGGGCK